MEDHEERIMPATIEAPRVGTINVTDSRTEKALNWVVVLHNCNCHSFQDVEDALVRVIRCDKDKAKEHAMNVHKKGREVVFSGHKERAEAKYVGLKEDGLVVELTQ
jgi:ATP-dependent Clp protease adapter protein ClpS